MNVILVFLQKAITQGIPLLLGANGEILTEKSGNLNLGIPGLMYMGGVAGLIGAFLYENNVAAPVPVVGMLIALFCCLLVSALGALIYSVLTITLRANQNVTGLALTTFGMGFGNFFGGSLSKLSGGVGQLSTATTASAFRASIPGLRDLPVVGQLLFSHGFLTYFAVIITIVLSWFLFKTRTGLNLRAVGESAATADAAGISVTRYKYLATCLGAGISGLGGLYYVLDYNQGIWATTGQIEALGWLAVALVIFTTWKPLNAIWGSYLFGLLYWLYQFLPTLMGFSVPGYITDLIQMVPYLVTIAVLIFTALRKKREDQPPASLGLAYFREER